MTLILASRAAWLAARREGIGASDVPAILGIGYGHEAAVLASKLYPPADDQPDPPWAEWGRRLEPVILAAFAERHPEIQVTPEENTLRFDAPPAIWAVCSLDAVATLPDGSFAVVEAKTSSGFDAAEWGPSGTAEIPPGYWVQVQWQLGVTGWATGYVPALLRGNDYREYQIAANPGWYRETREFIRDWRQRHVLSGEELEPDGSAAFAGYLRAKYPALAVKADAPLVEATPATTELIADYAERRREVDALALDCEAARQRIQMVLGDLPGVTGEREGKPWKLTWKPDRRGRRTFRLSGWPGEKTEGEHDGM